MNTLNRLLINICSDNLDESKVFYTSLFDFQIAYDSDWYVQLVSIDKKFELGIIDRENEAVPETYQKTPQGTYITFVVENTDDVHELAIKEGYNVVAEPIDTAYGQRRLLLTDPNGMLVDISSPIANFRF